MLESRGVGEEGVADRRQVLVPTRIGDPSHGDLSGEIAEGGETLLLWQDGLYGRRDEGVVVRDGECFSRGDRLDVDLGRPRDGLAGTA